MELSHSAEERALIEEMHGKFNQYVAQFVKVVESRKVIGLMSKEGLRSVRCRQRGPENQCQKHLHGHHRGHGDLRHHCGGPWFPDRPHVERAPGLHDLVHG